jgi:HEAT repeat protein
VIRLSRDLVDGLAAPRKLREAAPEVVHAALAADGGELRGEAIRVAGQRQMRQEIPQLLKLLNDPDEATRDAALGALIAMKEPRAVTELTKTRSLRDRREMRKILEAVSLLGGQEARDFLSFVAATHDEEEIRTEAAAAKARLERREAEAGQTK